MTTIQVRSGIALFALASACSRGPADVSGPHSAGRADATHDPRAELALAKETGAQPSSVEHCAHHQPMEADTPLPGESLYQLRAQLTDQHGAALELRSFRGAPLLVTMFYASCTSICPMLIGQLERIELALEPEQRSRTRVLLISLDPERDTVDALGQLARRHGVDQQRWSFTRTAESSVREAAALLGIRYRVMPDGEISHSPVISLLDSNGVLVKRSEGAPQDPAEMASAMARLLTRRPASRQVRTGDRD